MMAAPMHAHISSFTNVEGMKLYAEWWTPCNPTAVLVVVHGISEHSGRYGPMIEHFVRRGFAVAIYDQRGHGKSEGERGVIKSVQDFVSDLGEFIEVTKARYPDLPCFLVGHSFGGQISINYTVRYAKGLAGLLLSSPNIKLKMKIPAWKRWCIDQIYKRAPEYQLKHEIDPKWLSHDQGVVRRYAEDPRIVKRISLHGAREVFRNQEVIMAFASRIHVPCFFMHAGDDRICCPTGTEQFFRRVPVAQKSLRIYEGMYHELFNETARQTVFRDMEQWIDSIVYPEQQSAPRDEHKGATETHVPSHQAGAGEHAWGEIRS